MQAHAGPSDKVKRRLQTLPDKPGVYFMRDRAGRIIYVGKAASLRNRVRSYFRQGTLRGAPPKLRGLIKSIDDFDFLVVRTEAEAVLTEGRLIKAYRPRYNVAFKDDKRFPLLRVRMSEPFPRIEACRIRREDGCLYFGPYANSAGVRAAVEFVEKRFGLRRCRPRRPDAEDHRHCIDDIVRFCSAPCIGKVSEAEYRARVEEACAFLRGERKDLLDELKAAMMREAEARHFEKAAALRDTLAALWDALKKRARGDKKPGIAPDDALEGVRALGEVLGLEQPPDVIEGFDLSNISGTLAVGGMVVAVGGLAAPNRYRTFRIRAAPTDNDPAMMAEVIRRRYGRILNESRPLPDLVMVDGGLTQLRAAQDTLRALGLDRLPVIGLAKRFEEIHLERDGRHRVLRLPDDSPALQVLKRLRDEAHRFALTYHRRVRNRRIRESRLDEVEGVGERRKRQLLEAFGSIERLARASEADLAAQPGIGPKLARAIREQLSS